MVVIYFMDFSDETKKNHRVFQGRDLMSSAINVHGEFHEEKLLVAFMKPAVSISYSS